MKKYLKISLSIGGLAVIAGLLGVFIFRDKLISASRHGYLYANGPSTIYTWPTLVRGFYGSDGKEYKPPTKEEVDWIMKNGLPKDMTKDDLLKYLDEEIKRRTENANVIKIKADNLLDGSDKEYKLRIFESEMKRVSRLEGFKKILMEME